MSDIIVKDPRFKKLIVGHARLEKLYTGCRWAEGPAYFAAGRYLVWSDIPNNRIMRFDETDSSVSVFRNPSHYTNGHTVDREGRLISCEHQGRCVSRTEHDGTRTVLVSHYEGRKLNSPNDVVVKSDGSIWFTDPTYGIDSDYEGDKAASEQGDMLVNSRVYRLEPDTGHITAVVTDMVRPNGLAFSPDETVLYIADTGRSHKPDMDPVIRAYAVSPDGRHAGNGRLFATSDAGFFDGFRLDVEGNIWTSTFEGVRCYAPDGTHIGTVPVPEIVANVCFGGFKRNRLYICGQTSLYSYFVATNGAIRPVHP